MDASALFGIALGLGGILAGNFLEGGHFSSLMQMTAAIIVFGGTAGATMVANTARDLKMSLVMLRKAFSASENSRRVALAQELIAAAQLARRESVLSLEKQLAGFSDPFMRTVFRFVVDGVEPETLRSMFEAQIRVREDQGMSGGKVWSDAGGYAPTIGIIGAVLGLIHVMANLTDTAELGKGIAVAFVATIYGVGSANLLLLPIATKIKRRVSAEAETHRMILSGATAIAAGMNPYLVAERVNSYLQVDTAAQQGA